MTYKLPDNKEITIAADYQERLADAFLYPQLFYEKELLSTNFYEAEYEEKWREIMKGGSLTRLIFNAIDEMTKKEFFPHGMVNKVVLTGGQCLMFPLIELIARAIEDQCKNEYACIQPHLSIDPRYSIVEGARIFSSMGKLDQFLMSKIEYEEFGPEIISKKCF